MAGPYKEAARRLYETAQSQQGFFTTKQALRAGFAEKTHAYHVKVGNWIRVSSSSESLNPGITSVTISSQKPISCNRRMVSRMGCSARRADDSGGHQNSSGPP